MSILLRDFLIEITGSFQRRQEYCGMVYLAMKRFKTIGLIQSSSLFLECPWFFNYYSR